MSKHKIDLNHAFSGAMIAQEIPTLEKEIERLTLELSQKEGEIDILIKDIYPNTKQPRKSFYVVERMCMSLREEGQKSPIELVQTSDNKYLLFDGECRWRAAKKLQWERLRAIVKTYNPKSFDDDVLTSAIVRSNLNALDLAEAIINKISFDSSKINLGNEEKLTSKRICTLLNTAVVRLKRKKQHKLIGKLINKSRAECINELKKLELNELERDFFLTIMKYGINPISLNQNYLPMLGLPQDIKKAIRDLGLGDSQARTISKLNSKRLKISEEKAVAIRNELIQLCLSENLSIVMLGHQVEEIICEFDDKPQSKFSKNVKTCLQTIEKLKVSRLTKSEKEALISSFENLLQIIK